MRTIFRNAGNPHELLNLSVSETGTHEKEKSHADGMSDLSGR